MKEESVRNFLEFYFFSILGLSSLSSSPPGGPRREKNARDESSSLCTHAKRRSNFLFFSIVCKGDDERGSFFSLVYKMKKGHRKISLSLSLLLSGRIRESCRDLKPEGGSKGGRKSRGRRNRALVPSRRLSLFKFPVCPSRDRHFFAPSALLSLPSLYTLHVSSLVLFCCCLIYEFFVHGEYRRRFYGLLSVVVAVLLSFQERLFKGTILSMSRSRNS